MTKPHQAELNSLDFGTLKAQGKKIVMLTAYDYAMARAVAQTDIDLILVGDSLGMVVLGYDSTLDVKVADMIHHCAAVRRGATNKFIIVDMPYMSYHLSIEQSKANAAELLIGGRANAVKLEGGSDSRLKAIEAIVDCEIPVCAHLGLTPQSIHKFGGYKVQGKGDKAMQELLRQAHAVEDAGAFMIVLEGIPEELGKLISAELSIPTIGIGAGRYTDGQVLVVNDLLGYSGYPAKFVKRYAELDEIIVPALQSYAQEVREGVFPSAEHCYYPIETNTTRSEERS